MYHNVFRATQRGGLAIVFGLLALLLSIPLDAQNRDFSAERLIIDDDASDGGRNTLTLQGPIPGLFANRTVTFPDADGTILTFSGPGLTLNQILFGGSTGQAAQSANLLWDNSNSIFNIGAGLFTVDGTTGATTVGGTPGTANVRMGSLSGNALATPYTPSATDGIIVADNNGDLLKRSVASIVAGAAWALTGNSGTTPGTNFIGTTDNVALRVRTNNTDRMIFNTNGSIQRDAGGNARGLNAIDLQADRGGATQVSSGDQSVIGGGSTNTASGVYSTVGGGFFNTASGANSTIGGGGSHLASGLFSTVGGGTNNTASGQRSFVGGGAGNTASGLYSTVAGGTFNTATVSNSTVAGGESNTASGVKSTVGGGSTNSASGLRSVVSGGESNSAVTEATVSGGLQNSASGVRSTVGGGSFHTASGANATVSGGSDNTASGDFSVVSGGASHTASGSRSTVGGGETNTASGFQSTVAGGTVNVASNTQTTIAGGNGNTASGVLSSIGGGSNNVAAGDFTAIPGGRGLTLDAGAAQSFGFNANGGSNDMTISAANVAVFGNADLWLANNDNSASQIRFYEANATTGSFPPAGTNYTSFQAATQAADITYTLPATPPAVNGDVLTATTAGVMSWTTLSTTVSTDATLVGDGTGGNPLGLNLANANSWTATQTLPTTAAQGDALIASVNSGTTTIDAARIGAGLTDAQVNDNLTVNGGTVDATPVGATTESTGRFTTVEATTVLGAVTTPAAGTTYRDNSVIAWGDIAAAGIVNDQFGNAVVIHTPGTGVYTVTLPNSPTAAATTVTLQSIGFVTVTRAGSVLTITTFDTTATPTDLDFYYITVGRP
ncbi:MAG: beta strand repeat-containing protein [Candidatus Kapaibacterium sp.]